MTVTGLALLDASEISNEDPTGPSTFGKQFLDSMKAHGFAKLANHGIPAEEVATVFQVVHHSTHLFNTLTSLS